MRPKYSERCASSIDGSSEFLACGEHRRSIVALAFGRRVSRPYQTLLPKAFTSAGSGARVRRDAVFLFEVVPADARLNVTRRFAKENVAIALH